MHNLDEEGVTGFVIIGAFKDHTELAINKRLPLDLHADFIFGS